MSDAEVVTAYRCMECEAVSEEPAEGSLYECSRCGQVFTQDTSADGGSNRCPQCNIFGGKLADLACPECNEGEMEEVRAVDIDGELIVIPPEVEDNAARRQALQVVAWRLAEEQQREAAKAAREQEDRERFNSLSRVRASEVLPGDLLGYHDPNSSFDKYPEFKVGRVYRDDEGHIGLDPPGGIGLCFVCDPSDVFALIDRPEVTPENEPSLAEKIKGLEDQITASLRGEVPSSRETRSAP